MTKSKIFLYLCSSFVIGVFVASLIKIPLLVLGGFFIFGVILVSVFWARNPVSEQARYGASKKVAVAGFCLVVIIFGAWRYWQKEQEGNLSQFNDQGRLTIEGKLVEPADKRATSQRLKIEAEKLFVNGKQIKVFGLALTTTNPYPEYKYGDWLKITGQLREPSNFKDFDYKNYLAKSDIYSVVYYPEIEILAKNQGSKIKSSLFWLKQKFESSVEKLLPEPQASFLAGLTLGERRQIPAELSEAFKKTGTAHIVALSGYNITLIASFLMTIFGFFMIKRDLTFWLAVLGIVFFTILTGASASVVRAAIMGILVLVARQAGRLYSGRNALVLAGAIMIFINPKILRFDIGFQLSFLATAGLVWLAPVFEKWFQNLPKLFGLKEILITTLAAQLSVLPLLLIYFGQLSIISPLANLVVLLFIPITMLIGFVAGGIGMIWLVGAKIFGWLVWLLLTLEIRIIEFFASLPFSSLKMSWGWPVAVIYYLIMVGVLYLFYQKQKKEILVEKYADN